MSTPILAMIPSGRKATKLYSVLPTDGTGDFDFSRASSATRVNSAGLIESVLANLPRLDYLGSSCPRLLLEPQRTNALTFSESFDNAGWGKLYTTISPNTTDTLDPSGYYGADKIIDNATVSSHVVYQAGQWDTTQRTASVYAKAGTSSKVSVLNVSLGTGVFADLSAETIFVSAGFTGTLTSVGNGWFRITATHTAATPQTFSIGLFTGTNTSIYGGTGSYAYIWGAQVEAGAYATSYIPTLGAAVTRGADACTGAGNDQVINSTEGVLYAEMSALADDGTSRNISIFQNGSNFIKFQYSATSNRVDFVAFSSGAVSCNITKVITNTTENAKFGLKWKLNDFAFWINGVEVGTDLSGNTPIGMDKISFTNEGGSSGNLYGNIKELQVFTTALTDAELIALTTI